MTAADSVVFADPKAAKVFECPICYEMLKEPVQIGCNDHIFCRKCVLMLITPLTKLIRCPMCRVSCKKRSIRRVKFIERQINDLLVKCPNHTITPRKERHLKWKRLLRQFSTENKKKKRKLNDEELCVWIGSFANLESHQKQCSLELVYCDFCHLSMLQKELKQHHEICAKYPIKCAICGKENIERGLVDTHTKEECPLTIIRCRQQCGTQLLRANQENHIKNDCTETFIQCTFYKFGCFQQFKRKDEKQHVESASMTHNHLVKISEKVDQLRLKVDLLEYRRRMETQSKTIVEINYPPRYRKDKKVILKMEKNARFDTIIATLEHKFKSKVTLSVFGSVIRNTSTPQLLMLEHDIGPEIMKHIHATYK